MSIVSACLILCLLICSAGVACLVDVGLQDESSGFFLKPLSSKEDPFTTLTKRFVITQPVRQHSQVTASTGQFTATDHITRPMLRASLGNDSRVLKHLVIDDLDISVHLVSHSITQEWPILQALGHASHLSAHSFVTPSKDKKFGKKAAARTTTTTESPMPLDQPEPKNCLQVHVQKSGEEIRSSCLLERTSPVATCLAQLVIPPGWWQAQQSTVDVYYSVVNVTESLVCPTSGNFIVPMKIIDDPLLTKVFVSTATLSTGKLPYREVQQDQHLLVYIPQRSFSPGTRFTVPVKLQAESDVSSFSVRARARKGLRVVGIVASNPEVWNVNSSINKKHKNAVVAATVKDTTSYAKTDKKQHIFDWVFQVETQATDLDVGRILLTIEYTMHNHRDEAHGVRKRVVVRVNLEQEKIHNIVPVIKTTELTNTAVLSGSPIHHRLEIYGVTKSGKIMKVTNATTCHSGDRKVLQVHPRCQTVYLSGEESNGSTSISIIAKYNTHTKFVFFTVWYPELPLEIELTDHRLSQIKGWKAPKFAQQISRQARGVAFGYIQHPARILEKHSSQQEDLATTCHLRYQQTVLKVFTKLKAHDATRRNVYFLGRRASFDVTHLVQNTLRIADTSIATLDGNVVTGAKPGRTEVQVVSANGRCIGAKDIKVGNDKVSVQGLAVNLVTGLDIHLQAANNMPGTIIARTVLNQNFDTKYQEGTLDVSVRFSDNTSLRLGHVPAADYFLDLSSRNERVLSFGPMLSKAQPKVIAIGQGQGELMKISLELGDACQRKTTKPLATKDIFIKIQMKKRTTPKPHDDQPVKPAETSSQRPTAVSPAGDKTSGSKTFLAPEAQMMGHIGDSRVMTPLETGMYALLGVFCLAIIVFLTNCGLFVSRYRKKRMLPADTTVSSHDWVWIGSATLERNAVNTQCSRALMTEEDFNGNQSRTPPGRRGSNRNSATSVVSTYKGSECSIRITSNPMPDAPVPAASTSHPPGGLDTNGNHETDPGPKSRRGSGVVTNPKVRPSSSRTTKNDFTWDCESMGLSYNELMEYFDNLKESSA